MKELTLEITDHCSLNCLHCSTMAGKQGKNFWDIDKVVQYLDRFKDFGVVRISGGEPFEHRSLPDIVERIHSQGRKVHILSCGVKEGKPIPELDMKMVAEHIDSIVFSLHGYIESHEQIVTSDRKYLRHPPYWDYLMDSVDNAEEAGIPLSFQTVLMQENYHDLSGAALCVWSYNHCYGKDAEWHILRFVKQGRGKIHADQALDKEQLGSLPSILDRLREKYGLTITCSNSYDWKCCGCGTGKAVVTATEEIIPCSALKEAGSAGAFGCRKRL